VPVSEAKTHWRGNRFGLASSLLSPVRMTAFSKKLMQILETRFGVGPEFSDHLGPLLERFGSRQPSAEECEELLVNLASAYQASRVAGLQSLREVNVLVGQVESEVKKMDEALKVLGVCIERLRQQMKVPSRPHVLH
jgi:hypothetical protein